MLAEANTFVYATVLALDGLKSIAFLKSIGSLFLGLNTGISSTGWCVALAVVSDAFAG